MQTVTSFCASALESGQLKSILADYVAVQRLRTVRRLLIVLCAPLALFSVVAGAGLHWLSPFVYRCSTGMFLTLPLSACVVELRRARRLGRRLAALPGATTYVVQVAKGQTKKISP